MNIMAKRVDTRVEVSISIQQAMTILEDHFFNCRSIEDGKVFRGHYNPMIDRFIREEEETGDIAEVCLAIKKVQELISRNGW